jgi:hypothetical protein
MIAYRGSTTQNSKFVVPPSTTNNSQFGGGIYFADDILLAKKFGQNISIVDINTKHIVTERTPLNRTSLTSIAKLATKEALARYDTDPKVALSELTKDILDNKNSVDAVFSLWHDAFLKDSITFAKACTRYGITGSMVKAISAQYIIVYDPSIVTLLDEQRI